MGLCGAGPEWRTDGGSGPAVQERPGASVVPIDPREELKEVRADGLAGRRPYTWACPARQSGGGGWAPDCPEKHGCGRIEPEREEDLPQQRRARWGACAGGPTDAGAPRRCEAAPSTRLECGARSRSA
ncbi:hypothetical protein NDU88_003470 [Pleurodeles waltl]|uniref:Uncharacterized protein n=1 Tax=Pleurodeles waltl TaxID=8319 RepID=A0AAV7M744_PLEWA|nr:hypothetical protein NDU88_003470 [Pleurodeles waltl]